MKYKAIVTFGTTAVNVIEEIGLQKAIEEGKCDEFSFETEAERIAFFKGLSFRMINEHVDWLALNVADINGTEIRVGAAVDVPQPNKTDVHQHEFRGTIAGFRADYVIVEDGDGNKFEIEPERLEIVPVFHAIFDYGDTKEFLLEGLNTLSLEDLKMELIELVKDKTHTHINLLKRKDVKELAAEFGYIIQESDKPFEHEKSPYFWVDVPKNDGEFEEWENVIEFRTELQAKKFARENFGANTEGKIKIVTP